MANPSQIAASACVASARRPREIRRFFMEHMSGDYAEKWKKQECRYITGSNDENDVHGMYAAMKVCTCFKFFLFAMDK